MMSDRPGNERKRSNAIVNEHLFKHNKINEYVILYYITYHLENQYLIYLPTCLFYVPPFFVA